MIDLIQEMVIDEINDAMVECNDEWANALDKRLEELQTDMKNYRDDQGIGPHDSDRRLLEEDEHYANMKTNEENMKKALELTVNKHTFAQLCNHSVPKYMYTEMYNNWWDLCHGYMTTDLTSKQMETFYETAAEDAKMKILTSITTNANTEKKQCAPYLKLLITHVTTHEVESWGTHALYLIKRRCPMSW